MLVMRLTLDLRTCLISKNSTWILVDDQNTKSSFGLALFELVGFLSNDYKQLSFISAIKLYQIFINLYLLDIDW